MSPAVGHEPNRQHKAKHALACNLTTKNLYSIFQEFCNMFPSYFICACTTNETGVKMWTNLPYKSPRIVIIAITKRTTTKTFAYFMEYNVEWRKWHPFFCCQLLTSCGLFVPACYFAYCISVGTLCIQPECGFALDMGPIVDILHKPTVKNLAYTVHSMTFTYVVYGNFSRHINGTSQPMSVQKR